MIRKRPDGYHDLLSLMCRIGVFDTLRIELTSGPLRLECVSPGIASGAPACGVPADESNLAHRAARVFYQALGKAGGADIRLVKRIPVTAGLGGGSSDAAAVLMGLNRLHAGPFSRRRLMALGRTLGADVPFFIFEWPALAAGIGDRLERYDALPPCRVLLVCPPLAVSTASVFRALNLRLTNCRKKITKSRLKIETYSPALHSCNDLEAVTLGLHPELVSIKHLLAGLGAVGTLMSGSGPTIFGLFAEPALAEKAAAALPQDRGWRVILTELLRGPIELISEDRTP